MLHCKGLSNRESGSKNVKTTVFSPCESLEFSPRAVGSHYKSFSGGTTRSGVCLTLAPGAGRRTREGGQRRLGGASGGCWSLGKQPRGPSSCGRTGPRQPLTGSAIVRECRAQRVCSTPPRGALTPNHHLSRGRAAQAWRTRALILILPVARRSAKHLGAWPHLAPSQQTPLVGVVVIPISQMRKLRPRKAKSLAQGHSCHQAAEPALQPVANLCGVPGAAVPWEPASRV